MHENCTSKLVFLHFHCLGTLPICNWINGSEASFTSRYEHQIPLFSSSSSFVINGGACAWYRKNTKTGLHLFCKIYPTYVSENCLTIQNLLFNCIDIFCFHITCSFRIILFYCRKIILIRYDIYWNIITFIWITNVHFGAFDIWFTFKPMIKVQYQNHYHVVGFLWHTYMFCQMI